MADKWYNSQFASYLGEGLAIAALCLGIGYGVRGCHSPTQTEVDLERAKAKQVIQQADINNNGVLDKFYVVDGKIAVVELDGKPVASSLDAEVLEK